MAKLSFSTVFRGFLIILIALLFVSIYYVNKSVQESSRLSIKFDSTLNNYILIREREYRFITLYDAIIDNLKESEGYKPNPYNCPSGYQTVGYGHKILKTDIINFPLSEIQATMLLRQDFDKCVTFVKNTTVLEDEKLLAMALFVFNLGGKNFLESQLYSNIVAGQPIGDELLRFTHYRKDTAMINSKHLKQRRFTETLIFNSKYKLITNE